MKSVLLFLRTSRTCYGFITIRSGHEAPPWTHKCRHSWVPIRRILTQKSHWNAGVTTASVTRDILIHYEIAMSCCGWWLLRGVLFLFFFYFVRASAQSPELDVHGVESRGSAGACPSLINHGLAQQAQLHLDTCWWIHTNFTFNT